MGAAPLMLTVGVLLVSAACTNGIRATSTPDVSELSVTSSNGRTGCDVTEPGDQPTPLPEGVIEASGSTGWYGDGDLWVLVPGRDWTGILQADGTIGMKIPWWRVAEGDLSISAERLDGDGTATASIPDGYGAAGFQASGVTFSTPGCWRVTGTLAATTISFIVEAGA